MNTTVVKYIEGNKWKTVRKYLQPDPIRTCKAIYHSICHCQYGYIGVIPQGSGYYTVGHYDDNNVSLGYQMVFRVGCYDDSNVSLKYQRVFKVE